MPTNNNIETARPLLLIRNDVYEDYGKEVRSVNDFLGLLTRLKAEDPYSVPAAASPVVHDRMSGVWYGYTALNLFLPGFGYEPLINITRDTNGLPSFLWMDSVTGKAEDFFDIDSSVSAMAELVNWNEKGLIDFIDFTKANEEELIFYPTLLLNLIFHI